MIYRRRSTANTPTQNTPRITVAGLTGDVVAVGTISARATITGVTAVPVTVTVCDWSP